MALQISIIPFIGRLGDIIGYCRDGKHYLRSMSKKVRQTKATRRAAKRFGIASKRGALYHCPHDHPLQCLQFNGNKHPLPGDCI